MYFRVPSEATPAATLGSQGAFSHPEGAELTTLVTHPNFHVL